MAFSLDFAALFSLRTQWRSEGGQTNTFTVWLLLPGTTSEGGAARRQEAEQQSHHTPVGAGAGVAACGGR